MSDPTTIRRLYGRRQAFALRNRAQRLVEEFLPTVAVPKEGPLDAARLFGKACPLELEIGFGKGEHLVAHADPWPKARHAKRRFVNPGPLDLIAAKLKPGGEFRLATDHPVYMRWAVMQMARRDDFEWLAERASDWETRPDDWPATRYGEWAAGEGRPIWYFRYLRK